MTGCQWGAVRAKVVDGKLAEIKPFEFDKHPTEMIQGIKGILYGESRVRYPMVRLDWLKNREKSDRLQRGDNRFVRVSWDEALDLFYQELETHPAKLRPLGTSHCQCRLAFFGAIPQLRKPYDPSDCDARA